MEQRGIQIVVADHHDIGIMLAPVARVDEDAVENRALSQCLGLADGA